MKLTALFLLGASLSFAAHVEPAWQIGTVRDAMSNRTRSTLRQDQVMITGLDYTYTVSDDMVANRNNGSLGGFVAGSFIQAARNAKHGCRYIVGDRIQYLPHGQQMKVKDADGKVCNVEIVRQERNQ